MNTKDYFKDIYSDFFGIEVSPKNDNENKFLEKGSQEIMTSLFERINSLYLKEEDKELLKKIITYMRKYKEQIEKNYVPFNIIIKSNNSETTNKVISIIYEASKYFNYILNSEEKDISLYDLDKEISIDKYGLIIIKNLNGLNLEDDKIKKKFIFHLEDFLRKNSESITIISGNNDEITNFFLGIEEVKNKYFTFEIEGINPDIQDIYQYLLEKIKTDDKQKVELLDYITKTYHQDSNYIQYQNDLVNYLSFHKELPKIEEDKSLNEIFANLNELVGLEKVKKVLYELVDVINLKEKAGSTLNIKNLNLHMVFLGNPGTGKTTIARIIADILYNLKYIKENKLIEVSSKDLVAEYVGQTAPKTMSVIEKSLNGVLFIDEAYSLAVKGENSYNAEAIATLIQAMENYRDKLVVIFAGYTKEMQDFLDSNSGIVSRIGYVLEFDDYTTEELIKIFLGMMEKSGFVVEDKALKYLEEIINNNRHVKNFGNARFVRNIYEKTIIKHASNVKDKKQKKILKTITKEDISTDNLILE